MAAARQSRVEQQADRCVQPLEEKGVGLATMAEDGALQYLAWPDYPPGKPPRRWRDGGTIDAWLQARPPRVHGTGSVIIRAPSSTSKSKAKSQNLLKSAVAGVRFKLNH